MPKGRVEIKNSNNHDNFVSVRDLNLAGGPVVWRKQRLNSGSSGTCSLELDGSGKFQIEWEAVRTDDSSESRREDESNYPEATVFISSY